MKTILNNPIFINPLAYHVFPNLYGRLLPLTDTTIEPARYTGDIIINVIANGDTHKFSMFSDTDFIDLEGFFNTWIRISQYNVDGAVVLGEWKLGDGGEDKPELPEEIKEALCGIWIADQNTNDSPTRNIIKNKIANAGGDFEILNAAYKLNSGYGKYETDFTIYNTNSRYNVYTKINHSTIIGYNPTDTAQSYVFVYTDSYQENIDEYYIVIESLVGSISYRYIDNTGKLQILKIETNGKHLLPKSYNSLPTTNQWVGYTIAPNSSASITQIPKYQGAFVTDGVDDLIVSQKSVSEMLGGSNELTVVSMIHQIEPLFIANNKSYTNYIRSKDVGLFRNDSTSNNKLGIYGYKSNIDTIQLINDILGDKNDYIISSSNRDVAINNKFSVEGYIGLNNSPQEMSQVAWYWTLIAKRVLTTDEINQVIAYYNLDKYVAPDVYYDVKKQGLTNENHADFGDKLIDYSGNGKDMQLYNFGWKLDSGIGKWDTDFNSWVKYGGAISTLTKITVPSSFNQNWIAYMTKDTPIPTFKVRISGIPNGGFLSFISNSVLPTIELTNGINEINGEDKLAIGWTGFNRRVDDLDWSNLVIEQLPSFEGALVSDGATDYGQYVGDLGLKDYTVVADRAYVELIDRHVPIISNIAANTNTPFIFEFSSPLPNVKPFSFNANSTNINKPIDTNRKVSYQSTYIYNGDAVTRGTITNTGDGLTFGRYGTAVQYAKLCLYNFMLFPYSLSEFLIERQLKKRKIGTLYPETNNK